MVCSCFLQKDVLQLKEENIRGFRKLAKIVGNFKK